MCMPVMAEACDTVACDAVLCDTLWLDIRKAAGRNHRLSGAHRVCLQRLRLDFMLIRGHNQRHHWPRLKELTIKSGMVGPVGSALVGFASTIEVLESPFSTDINDATLFRWSAVFMLLIMMFFRKY